MSMPDRERFKWTAWRDELLTRDWPIKEPASIARFFGCSLRAVYKRAGEINLGPRDPERRALWLGQAPRHPRAISLARVPLLERPFVSDDCPTADGASGPAGGGFAPIQPHRSAGRTHHARAMR